VFAPICLDAGNPGPKTGRGNNTYLIASPGGSATLVDAGTGEASHLEAIAAALAAVNSRLERVLVTHGHPDHASGAPALAQRYPRATFAKFPPLGGEWPGVAWQPLADDQRVVVGEEHLVVIHTPGHSPDHVIFWHEPSRTALTGDLVIPGGSVMIPWNAGGDLAQYLQSLERVAALNPLGLLPAHGPMVSNAVEVLDAHRAHRLMRERQILAALESGRQDVQAIAESIYHGLEPALEPAARESVRAHLEKLKAENRAAVSDGKWTIRWTRSSTSST
jgi:glyoxylase-like metal-dependent hydrolase (beta-lactamase superfamily II)